MADTPVAAPTTAPKNGAHPAQPQQPVTPPAQSAPVESPELKTLREKAERAEAEALKYKRETVVGRRQWEREKQTFGEKLKAADEYERLKREARVNPKSAAEKLWGEKYLEHLNTVAANGNAPTAESVAFEIEQREAKLRQDFAAERAKEQEEHAAAEQRALDARVRHFRGEVLAEVKAKGSEFELASEQFKTPEALEAAVFNYIVNHHASTTQKDPETGEILRQGVTMTPMEALSALESDLYSIADRAAGKAKYADKLREKLTPPKQVGTVSPVVKSSQSLQPSPQSSSQSSQQGRRTLSNDLTGSTPGDAPKYRTDAQRLADAIAAANAARK